MLLLGLGEYTNCLTLQSYVFGARRLRDTMSDFIFSVGVWVRNSRMRTVDGALVCLRT